MNEFDKKYTYSDARKAANYFKNYKDQHTIMNESANAARRKDIEDIRSYQNGIYKESFRRRQEQINSVLYTEEFNKGFLTEAFKRIVEQSLLLDADQYRSLNEHFEQDVARSIRRMLNSNQISANTLTEDMKVILNAASDIMPSYEMYKELFEDYNDKENSDEEDAEHKTDNIEKDIEMSVKAKELYNKAFDKEEVKKAIDNISADVKTQVADIVSSEQDKAEENLELLDKINELNKEDNLVKQVQADADSRAIEAQAVADINSGMANVGADPNAVPAEQPVEAPAEAKPAKEPIVQENYTHGIVEAIVINECKQMLSEGKEINSDLALANAIQFLTISEAFNVTGLIRTNAGTYNQVIKEAGLYREPNKDMMVGKKLDERYAEIDKRKAESKANGGVAKPMGSASAMTASAGVMTAMKPKSKVVKTYAEWKAEKEKANATASNAMHESVNEPVIKYTNDGFKKYTREELTRIFEAVGYNVAVDGFENICESLRYREIKE